MEIQDFTMDNIEFKKLDKETEKELSIQAEATLNSQIYKYMHSEMMRVATKKLFEAENMDQLMFAKACVWVEAVRHKKLHNLAKLSIPKPKPIKK